MRFFSEILLVQATSGSEIVSADSSTDAPSGSGSTLPVSTITERLLVETTFYQTTDVSTSIFDVTTSGSQNMSTTDANSNGSSDSDSEGVEAIYAIVFGSVGGVLLAAICIVVVCHRR